MAEKLTEKVALLRKASKALWLELPSPVAKDYSRILEDTLLALEEEIRTPDPRLSVAVEALREVEEFLEERAGAEYFTDSTTPVPYAESRLLGTVHAALSSLSDVPVKPGPGGE